MKEFNLIPINPFTRRQEDVIRQILAGNTSRKEISSILGVSPYTIASQINGSISYEDVPSIPPTNKSRLGIKGIIQLLTGNRPYDINGILSALLGDVILESSAPPPTR